MPFITLGTAAQLQIQIPTPGTTDWSSTIQTENFLKIAQHNHSGSGTGAQLGTGSILASAITGAKIRLDNDEYLRSRNNANSGDIDVIKLDTSDLIAFGASIGSATINTLTSTTITGTSATIPTITSSNVIASGSFVMADNVSSATTVTGVTALSADESLELNYKIKRNGVVQTGNLEFDDTSTIPVEEFSGTDVGVTFSVDSGVLKYTSTSTTFAPTISFVEVKK